MHWYVVEEFFPWSLKDLIYKVRTNTLLKSCCCCLSLLIFTSIVVGPITPCLGLNLFRGRQHACPQHVDPIVFPNSVRDVCVCVQCNESTIDGRSSTIDLLFGHPIDLFIFCELDIATACIV